MEVNDMKNLWKNSFAQSETKLSSEEIEAKLKIKSKTKSLMTKVKRSFQFELIFTSLIVIFFFIYYWPKINTNNQIFVVAIFIVFILSLMFFVWNKYRKLNSISIIQDQLKPAMISWIKILEKYISFNMGNISKFIIIPFAMILGFTLGLLLSAGDESFFEMLQKLGNWKTGILLLITYSLTVPLTKSFNKRLYGRHLDEMKQCLKDLEEIDESDLV